MCRIRIYFIENFEFLILDLELFRKKKFVWVSNFVVNQTSMNNIFFRVVAIVIHIPCEIKVVGDIFRFPY